MNLTVFVIVGFVLEKLVVPVVENVVVPQA
jgi:hypothetical protein